MEGGLLFVLLRAVYGISPKVSLFLQKKLRWNQWSNGENVNEIDR